MAAPARFPIGEGGARAAWFRMLSALGYRRLVITRHDLNAPRPERPLPFPAEFAFVTEADVAEYATLRPGSERLARARFADGDRCFGIRADGSLVYAIWFTTGSLRLEYLGRRLELGPHEVGLYDGFVREDLRRMGLARAGHAELRRLLTEAGYTAAIAAAFPENVAGARLQAEGAYLPVGLLRSICLGPFRLHFGRREAEPS